MANVADFERAASRWTVRNVREIRRRSLRKAVREGTALARRLAPRDSGDLRRSISGRVDEDAGHLVTTSPYGMMAEYGGTIRPRKGSYLAIPLRGQKHGPLSESGLFVRLAQSGHPYLARRVGDAIEPRYALRRAVHRKGGRFMARGFAKMRRRAREESARELRRLFSLRGAP